MCNSQVNRGQKNMWYEKGVQQIGQTEIHNTMIQTNPRILVSTANDINFPLNSAYIKLMKDISKVHEQDENEKGKYTSGKYLILIKRRLAWLCLSTKNSL